MRKYTLLRSVAIFSILVFLMMLTLGQLALSGPGTDIQNDGGVAKCGLLLVDKSFGNMSVKYTSRVVIKSDESQVCSEMVLVCRLRQERSSNSFIGTVSGSSTETDYCTVLTSQDFDDVSREKIKAVFLRLASDESVLASGFQDSIQNRVVSLAFDKKSEEAKELLKSYLYNQIWLADGT